MKLDALSQHIIQELSIDPHLTNKAIALKLEVSERTIGNRIDALVKSGVMRISAQRNVRSLGYEVMTFAEIWIEGRRAEEVSHALGHIEEIASLSMMLGSPELIAVIYARDEAHLLSIIDDQIAHTPGVKRIDHHIALEISKSWTRYGALVES